MEKFDILLNDAKNHIRGFTLWPDRWESCNPPVTLNWQIIQFEDQCWNLLPTAPGVYAFLIQPEKAFSLNASYLIYIGKTDRPMGERCHEHYNAMTKGKHKPKLYPYLRAYSAYLKFCYSEIDAGVTPYDIEQQLISSFIPPANDDLPAEIRDLKAAFPGF